MKRGRERDRANRWSKIYKKMAKALTDSKTHRYRLRLACEIT